MNRNREIVTFVLTALIAGCASDPIRVGNQALERGDCAGALKAWLPKAKAGEPAAQNNMAVLWEKGCAAANLPQNNTMAYNWLTLSASHGYPLAYQNLGFYFLSGKGVAKDQQQAIANFHFAARWGLSKSIETLRSLNAPIPTADLLAAAEARNQEDSAAAVTLGLLLLSGALEGYAAGRAAGSGTTYAPAPNGLPGSSSSTVTQPSRVLTTPACSSDFECGIGRRCAKPLYQTAGVCLQAVDSYG